MEGYFDHHTRVNHHFRRFSFYDNFEGVGIVGIDFSHGNASWSYSGFNSFRNKLVKELDIGITFNNMCDNMNMSPVKGQGIYPLLNHSDCDGELTPDEMSVILPQLREIVSKWPDDDFDKQQGKALIKGMEDAMSEKTNLHFC